MVVTLEAPSALSVGLCLAHAVTDKRPWLERLDVEASWPMSGKPRELYVDNAAEFKSEALRRGCEQHGDRAALPAAGPAALRRDRRAGDRHDDADGARAAGHDVLQHRASAAATTATRQAALTVRELERWLALAVAGYHGQRARGAGQHAGRAVGRGGRRQRRSGDGDQRRPRSWSTSCR